MFDEWLKIADFTVTAGVLVFVLTQAKKLLGAVVEWLPKFHGSVERQSKAVVDLAEGAKAQRETQEATLVAVRAMAVDNSRQNEQLGRILDFVQGLAQKEAQQ